MADDLAQLLASLSTGERRAPETTYGPFGEKYDVDFVEPPPLVAGARFGFRGVPQARFPGPWAKEPTAAPKPTREWKEPGDDSIGQNVYEAILGRVRKPGEAVARQGSGGGWGNPVKWIVGGLGGYGGYKVGEKIFGNPFDHLDALRKLHTQGTPEHEAEQKRRAGVRNEDATEQHKRDAKRPEMEALYGPESMQYGLPYGREGMKRFGLLAGRERTLPSQNGIPFPPDPNQP